MQPLDFIHRHLDPAESLGELYFGLLMALSFTLAASVVAHHEPDMARAAIEAAVGCNIAWGIIDGAMFVMGRMYDRARVARAHLRIRATGSPAERKALVEELLRQRLDLAPGVAVPQLDRLAEELVRVALAKPVPRNGLTAADLAGGLVVCGLVALTALWAALPLFFFEEPLLLLRVSNLISVAALFFLGWSWARHTNASPLRAGLISAGLGIVLVVVAVALGG